MISFLNNNNNNNRRQARDDDKMDEFLGLEAASKQQQQQQQLSDITMCSGKKTHTLSAAASLLQKRTVGVEPEYSNRRKKNQVVITPFV